MARTTTIEPPSAAGTAPAPPARRSRLRLVIVAAIAAGLVAGATAYLLLGDERTSEPAAAPAEGAVVEVAEMTLNLAGAPVAYARVTFAAVLAEGADAAAVAEGFPLLKDAAISEIGAFDAGTLRTRDGVEALRTSLSRRAVELYPDGEVRRIVLTELVVQ